MDRTDAYLRTNLNVAQILLPVQGRCKKRFLNWRQISPPVRFRKLRRLDVSSGRTRARVPVLRFQFAALGLRVISSANLPVILFHGEESKRRNHKVAGRLANPLARTVFWRTQLQRCAQCRLRKCLLTGGRGWLRAGIAAAFDRIAQRLAEWLGYVGDIRGLDSRLLHICRIREVVAV